MKSPVLICKTEAFRNSIALLWGSDSGVTIKCRLLCMIVRVEMREIRMNGVSSLAVVIRKEISRPR